MTTRAIDNAPTKLAPTSLDEAVKRIVDAAPKLTAAQEDRLRVLLRGAGATR